MYVTWYGQITRLKELGGGAPVVSVCPDTDHILATEDQRHLNLSPKELRLKCKVQQQTPLRHCLRGWTVQCALCVDEFSGVVRVQPGDIPQSLTAKTIEPKGLLLLQGRVGLIMCCVGRKLCCRNHLE